MYAEPRKFEKGHGGEDAYFVSEEHPSFGRRRGGSKEEEPVTHQAFGVADGVGDWVFVRGVDSSLFSHRLMELSKLLFETEPASSPAAVLGQSYELIQTEDIEGSSTVCIANFCRTTAILSIANLVRCVAAADGILPEFPFKFVCALPFPCARCVLIVGLGFVVCVCVCWLW